jgi:hypothetical protein
MTSFKQFEANRRNALKNTGPKSSEGKERSRCNAVRHGLTAETVIGVLENAEDYNAFEAAIVADYEAQSAAERELVLRLASLLWRLRRATATETGLFAMQAERLNELGQSQQDTYANTILRVQFQKRERLDCESKPADSSATGVEVGGTSLSDCIDRATVFAHCFLALSEMPAFPLDRLSRYEARLWRQASQVLFTLHALHSRKVEDRRTRFGINRWRV